VRLSFLFNREDAKNAKKRKGFHALVPQQAGKAQRKGKEGSQASKNPKAL
jgi:hypothetical protein